MKVRGYQKQGKYGKLIAVFCGKLIAKIYGKVLAVYTYLLYDTEAEDKRGETYAKRVDNSFNDFFNSIEALYPTASRDNDDLWEIILKFTTLHDEVYFEIGVIIGLQIYKNLEKASKRIVIDDTTSIQNSIL